MTTHMSGQSSVEEHQSPDLRRGDGSRRSGNRCSHSDHYKKGVLRLHCPYDRSSIEHYFGFQSSLVLSGKKSMFEMKIRDN